MKIRIRDIPPEGRTLEWSLDLDSLQRRLVPESEGGPARKLVMPEYVFSAPPPATVQLELEGSTVMIDGTVSAQFRTNCVRCLEPTNASIQSPVKMVLKSHSERSRPDEEVEDVQLGFYDGKEVDCAPIVEESLVLTLPLNVVCSESCRGLCPTCGSNLNEGACRCAPAKDGDERFSVLRGLKIQ
ncbi:MAG: DUF177 domain-containing protein [Deltaproteobacteria bacterium]|nr:DUF177 domain-containing protein [Deltaproteobacteria bacterium]